MAQNRRKNANTGEGKYKKKMSMRIVRGGNKKMLEGMKELNKERVKDRKKGGRK